MHQSMITCTVPSFITGKCAESRKQMSGLVDVAAVNLQVAVTLLRMCGSFCRMVHIARVTPPSLASDALRSSDEEVQRCFALCTAIEVPNGAWCQAQLGLKFGGLARPSLCLTSCCCCLHCIPIILRLWQC